MALAVAFLALQTANWIRLAEAVAESGNNLFTFTWWTLTVLHALHVIGGLVPLAVAASRASTGRYGSINTDPIQNIEIYWHFLGITWVGVLLVLVL